MIDRKADRHGYNPGEDEKVYEEYESDEDFIEESSHDGANYVNHKVEYHLHGGPEKYGNEKVGTITIKVHPKLHEQILNNAHDPKALKEAFRNHLNSNHADARKVFNVKGNEAEFTTGDLNSVESVHNKED